jgi:hypothetical protein
MFQPNTNKGINIGVVTYQNPCIEWPSYLSQPGTISENLARSKSSQQRLDQLQIHTQPWLHKWTKRNYWSLQVYLGDITIRTTWMHASLYFARVG